MARSTPGDPPSSALLEAHRAAIHRYLRTLVRDPSEAEDLTQETLLRAHRSLSTLRDNDKLKSWLFRIATHVSYDRLRQLARTSEAPGAESVAEDGGETAQALAHGSAPRLDQAIEQQEMSDCVQKYLEDLPETYRTVLVLHDLRGMTNPEIADALHVSLETVKIRIHRARRELKVALDKACRFSRDERGVLVCEPISSKP